MRNTLAYQLSQKLFINDVEYVGADAILAFAQLLKSEAETEKQCIGQFLSEWFNEETTIELQTSGSTGKPKQITVKKDAMVASAQRTLQFLNLKPDNTALLCLSANYIAGKMMLVRSMIGQLKLYTTNINSNPLQQFHQKVDFAAMVPLQVSAILKENKKALINIQNLIIGGGYIDHQVAEDLSSININSWETYGMTETVSHIAMRNIRRKEKAFHVLPGISVTSDERNCLVVEPSDINEDRLVTNDIVEFNSSKEFLLLGRYDNVINTGGVKVMAEEIERKIGSSLPVPFAISWKKDIVLGQKVVLVCESKETVSLNILSSTLLSRYEFPKEIVCVDEIPITETGKIQRNILQQLIDK